jgi:hypothetical protein
VTSLLSISYLQNFHMYDLWPWKMKLFVCLFIATQAIFQLSGDCHHCQWFRPMLFGIRSMCTKLDVVSSFSPAYKVFLLSNVTTLNFDLWPWKTICFFFSSWWSCMILKLTVPSLFCLQGPYRQTDGCHTIIRPVFDGRIKLVQSSNTFLNIILSC